MKVLIASGGTRVKLDPVRYLTNMSTGRFGSELAAAALGLGQEVVFFAAVGSRTPLAMNIDWHGNNNWQKELDSFAALHNFAAKYGKQYTQHLFSTFSDYVAYLEHLVTTEKPDVVMLPAAVSDYEPVECHTEKVRSTNNMSIELKTTQKVISQIKVWHPNCYLVGFKLLVHCTKEEQIEAAKKSIKDNGCDMVVTNDLESIKAGDHHVLLVEPLLEVDKPSVKYLKRSTSVNGLAVRVMEEVIRGAKCAISYSA